MDTKLQSLSDSFSKSLSNTFLTLLEERVTEQIVAAINQELQKINLLETIRYYVNDNIQPMMRDAILQSIKGQISKVDPQFKHGSIDGRAIDLTTLTVTGNNIVGGVIKKFQSTGIQDNSSACQVTVLDNATVIENKLIASSLDVKGSVTIDGDILVKGRTTADTPFFKQLVEFAVNEVSSKITPDFFNAYRDEMFDKIEQEGLHLKELTVNGKEIVANNKLGTYITESNLQQVGLLKQLQVQGEAVVFNTLYVGNKRVGINTIEPTAALTVWDEECQVVVGKRKQDIAMINAPRNQTLVVGAGNKDQLTFLPSGEVIVPDITIGKVSVSSAPSAPSTTEKKGAVRFNENPDIGQPLGWVSLGNGRWSEFGKIG